MKILNFGSLNLDYVYRLEHFVQPGETISASEQTLNPGGKGLNQSIALARAGAKVYHAGCIGSEGEMLRKLLRENAADDKFLHTVDTMQGKAIIQLTPSGENSIILFGGSNQAVTRTQVDETLDNFSMGDYLILQNEINELPYIVEKAYEKGMVIVLNPSPFNERLDAVDFNKISWFIVNEIEAEQLSGEKEAEKVWQKVHEKYPAVSMVITLGSAGSVAFKNVNGSIERAEQPSFSVTAVDTTAAGDTYTGYFVNGITSGKTLREAMKTASAAAAISVTRVGAAPSIPNMDETIIWMERYDN